MATVDVPVFHDLPDRSTPLTAAKLNEWGGTVKSNADAAESARDEAVAAAAEITSGGYVTAATDADGNTSLYLNGVEL